jgi:hypothetical protein
MGTRWRHLSAVTDARSDRFSGRLDLSRPLLQRRRRLGHQLGDDVGDRFFLVAMPLARRGRVADDP